MSQSRSEESLGSAKILNRDVSNIDRVTLRNEQGRLFATGVTFTDITAGAFRDILYVGSSLPAHIRGSVDLSGTWDVQTFEGASVSANGTSMPGFSCNRVNLTTPAGSFFHTPTVETTGSQLGPTGRILGGSGKVKDLYPAQGSRQIPLICDTSTNYLLRFTNQSGASVAAMQIDLNWTE